MFKKKLSIFNITQSILGKRVNFDVENREEFKSVILQLKAIPKKTMPTPHPRNLYLNNEYRTQPVTSFSMLRMFVLGASGALLFVFTLVGLGIYTSQPGKRLYAYKKTAERLQVNLTTSPEVKTEREFALAQKRLDEAREVIGSNPDNTKLTSAALNELASQTEHVIKTVGENVSKQSAPVNEEIANKLDTLVQDQLALLNTIESRPETEGATTKARMATDETSKQIASIKKITTTTVEETPTDTSLFAITTEGTITATSETGITIGSTVIIITPGTIIEADAGAGAKPPVLTIGQKIVVSSMNTKDGLEAGKIIIFLKQTEPQGTVKGANKKSTQETISDEGAQNSEDTPLDEPKPHETRGSFIPEDPNPQPIE